VLREAKRPAPILPQVARHPLAGLLAPVLCPIAIPLQAPLLLTVSPGSLALSSTLSAVLGVADPRPHVPLRRCRSGALAVPPRGCRGRHCPAAPRIPTSEDVPARTKGKREEAKNGGITDVVRSFKEEQVEELERMGVAFRSRPVRNAAARQVRLLMDFLKVRFFPSFLPVSVDCCWLIVVVNGLQINQA